MEISIFFFSIRQWPYPTSTHSETLAILKTQLQLFSFNNSNEAVFSRSINQVWSRGELGRIEKKMTKNMVLHLFALRQDSLTQYFGHCPERYVALSEKTFLIILDEDDLRIKAIREYYNYIIIVYLGGNKIRRIITVKYQ